MSSALASLVAFTTGVCDATSVEVHALGVAPEMVTQGDAWHWTGDPCAAHPTLRLAIQARGQVLARVTVRPSLSIWVDGWVTDRRVEPGDVVTGVPGSIRLDRQTALRVPAAGPWQAMATLDAGQPLTRGAVRQVPDAQRGAPVQVRVTRGAVTLTAEGRLLQDGALGEPVQVQNAATRTSMRGVLVTPEIVEIR